MTVAGGGPPPRTPRQGGEAEGRERAQGEHAPCKPQRGDRWGCNRRKGRVTTGATRQPPPPPPQRRGKCRASCLRRASDVHAQKGGQRERPPPPRPLLLRPPTKRARTARRQRGDMGAGRRKKKTQNEQQRTPTRPSRGRQQGQTGHGGSQGAQQGARDRGTPLGTKAGRQGPTGGGQGDKSPRTTLVRYPTSGVWGPPRRPYRPHLSASNKVGYARDRWLAARGGTGLGGWPMGLTKSTPHGTYCGSCPVRGCG